MGSLGGTRVIAPVRPWDSADNYPSHEALYGKGGLRTVSILDDRSAITTDRREAGMVVYVISQSEHYQLEVDLTSWAVFGGGSSTVDNISSIGDVTLDSQTVLQHLEFNGAEWVNKTAYPTGDPTGFTNRTDSVISFDSGTKIFTVSEAVSGVSFNWWINGEEFSASHAEITISLSQGLRYIAFTSATLTELIPTEEEDFINYAFAGMVYWDASASNTIGVGDERHGINMAGSTHYHFHETFGATYEDGLGLNSITVDGGTGDESSAQIGVGAGAIHDEDIHHDIDALIFPANIPILYLDGTATEWKLKPRDDYPIIWSDSATWTGANDRVPYNDYNSGNWTLTQIGNNDLVLVHYFATNGISGDSIIGIQGQAEYANKPAARAGANTELANLVSTGLPTNEFIAIATVIFQTNGGWGNTPKCKIISTDEGDDYIDWRTSKPVGTGGIANDHGSLGGLGDQDHLRHPYMGSSVITNVSNNDFLQWKTSSSQWYNVGDDTLITNLSAIGDVVISAPSAGDALTYFASSAEWKPQAPGAGASVDYLTHEKGPEHHTLMGYDSDNSTHVEIGPLVVIDLCGNLVYK